MDNNELAINGGERAVRSDLKPPVKVGKDELLEVLDLWQLSPEGSEGIRRIIENEKHLQGPHLFRYYNPRPSKVRASEKAMMDYVGSQYCLAMNSCTSALVSAYRALGIGAGDEVIVPAYTFFATAATVVSSNAVPVIVDIDESLCMDPEEIEKKITRRTKAIVPVHMRGAPAQMDAIMDVAGRKGIPVVEDVAQAAGGSFGGKMLGSIGTIGCFSFDYYKIIVSGEGGFFTTDDMRLYTRAQNWHDCAACWRPDRFGPETEGEELFCGENYRMSELQGAVALAQIRKAGPMIEGYRSAKRKIKETIGEYRGLTFRSLSDEAGDTGISLVMFLPDAEVTRKVLPALQAEGVSAGGVYDEKVRDWHTYNYWEHILEKKSVASDNLPWSAFPAGELPQYSREMCPRSLELLSRAILIDINFDFSDEECAQIGAAINKVFDVFLA